jgi:hypothetical protein
MNILNIARAAESAATTCSGSDCTVCSILETVGRIYNFLTGLSFAVAVLFLTLAGLVYVFGTGRKAYFLKAKNFARTAIVGFVFVLVGWLAIHAVLFSTGYKNAGNWWQFQCATDSPGYQTVSLNSISSYANVADFLASGHSQGIIKGAVSDAAFINQLKSLKPGEKLTFNLIAKRADTQEDIIIPFLAGYKDLKGNIKLSDSEDAMMEKLLALVTELQDPDNAKKVSDILFHSLLNKDPANFSLDEEISMSRNAFQSMQEDQSISEGSPNSSDGDTVFAKLENKIASAFLGNYSEGIVVNRSSVDSSDTKDAAKIASSTGQSATGSEGSSNKWQDAQSQQTGPMSPVDPSKWQKSMTSDQAPKGSQADDITDMLNKGRNQEQLDQLAKQDPDTFGQGDGSPRAIEKALKHICKIDAKRYEMIFQFVQHIGDQPGGGLCTGCGDIYVDHKARIFDMSHILVHEATHSGHACKKNWEGYTRGEIEAIACANGQEGASPITKGPDMKEIEAGMKQKPFSPEKGVYEARGYFYRDWNGVGGNLPGDIVDKIFQFGTDYAVKKNGYENNGKYIYGWGNGGPPNKSAQPLKLTDKCENVVDTVMTSTDPYKSCPTQWLIDQKCPTQKPCNAAPIQID